MAVMKEIYEKFIELFKTLTAPQQSSIRRILLLDLYNRPSDDIKAELEKQNFKVSTINTTVYNFLKFINLLRQHLTDQQILDCFDQFKHELRKDDALTIQANDENNDVKPVSKRGRKKKTNDVTNDCNLLLSDIMSVPSNENDQDETGTENDTNNNGVIYQKAYSELIEPIYQNDNYVILTVNNPELVSDEISNCQIIFNVSDIIDKLHYSWLYAAKFEPFILVIASALADNYSKYITSEIGQFNLNLTVEEFVDLIANKFNLNVNCYNSILSDVVNALTILKQPFVDTDMTPSKTLQEDFSKLDKFYKNISTMIKSVTLDRAKKSVIFALENIDTMKILDILKLAEKYDIQMTISEEGLVAYVGRNNYI